MAGALTVCRARSFTDFSAGLEAEADELRAAVEDSGALAVNRCNRLGHMPRGPTF